MKTLIVMAALFSSLISNAEQMESLLGYSFDESGITFQVSSNGCTRKSNFEFTLAETAPQQLRLYRNISDECELSVPYGTKIQYSWNELSLSNGMQVKVLNRLNVIQVSQRQ